MPITLQSSCGPFDESFVAKLPELEAAMVAQGLDPADFIIAKDRPTVTSRSFGQQCHDYTVYVGAENFTVTLPGDLNFLEYFYDRCVASDAQP